MTSSISGQRWIMRIDDAGERFSSEERGHCREGRPTGGQVDRRRVVSMQDRDGGTESIGRSIRKGNSGEVTVVLRVCTSAVSD